MAKIRQAIAAAAGLTPADTLSVVAVPFSTVLAKQAAKQAKAETAAKAKAQLYDMVKVGAVVAVIALALLVLWLKSRKRSAPAQQLAYIRPQPDVALPAPAIEGNDIPEIDKDVASRVLRSWLEEVPSATGAGMN